MGLLNLTLAEFLAILLPLSSALIALYLYQRIRRRRVVSSLRFWPRRVAALRSTRRWKLSQPLSLLLQVLALLFLLLAIAEPRLDLGAAVRHHVLILETSAWMSAQNENGTLMDQARNRALAYLRGIPPTEPAMLIRADGLPMPATRFTTDRAELDRAIRASQPGWTAVNLAAAFDLARSSLDLTVGSAASRAPSKETGEIAYVGTGRIVESVRGKVQTKGIRFLRFLDVGADVENSGIRALHARPDPDNPERWQVTAEIYNYGPRRVDSHVDFLFEERRIGGKTIRVAPNAAGQVVFSLRTQQAGSLRAILTPSDDFSPDDTANLLLPDSSPYPVSVYSEGPDRLRPLLAATRRLQAAFYPPLRFQNAPKQRGLLVFDQFVPARPPGGLYILPPAERSPLPVSIVVRQARITRWTAAHPLAEGLRSKDVQLEQTAIFEVQTGDTVIAETEAGPVIVARERDGVRSVFFGFDPARPSLQRSLVAPLLFANTIRWFAPTVFQSADVRAASPGLLETEVAAEREQDIEIISPENADVPWSLREGRLRFFAGQPGTVRVQTPSQRWDFALHLPELGLSQWQPPGESLRGIPPPFDQPAIDASKLWRWLALAGLFCLLLDWTLYGRRPEEAVLEDPQPEASPGERPVDRWSDVAPTEGEQPAQPERQVTR